MRLGSSLLPAIFALVCAVMQSFAFAASCTKPQVFFVNGVWNPLGYDASNTAVALTEAFVEAGAPSLLNVRTLWNPGDGYIADLAEVAIDQNLVRTGTDFINGVAYETGPRWAAWLQADTASASTRRRLAIEKIKSAVLQELRTNQGPVVLVAHSQGNIVVNNAIRELQQQYPDASGPNSVPGLLSIGILGIAVAAKNSTQPASGTYRWISSSRDLVISALTGVPALNFLARDLALDGGHPLLSHYLGNVYGHTDTDLTPRSLRAVTGELFVEVYNATQAAQPCVTVTTNPNSSASGEVVTLSATVTARPGDLRKPTGSVQFSSATGGLCSAPVDGSGKASCTYAFIGTPRTETISANYVSSGVFGSIASSSYLHFLTDAVAGGSYQFEILEAGRKNFGYCKAYANVPYPSLGTVASYDGCLADFDFQLRCVGAGCSMPTSPPSNRFFIAMKKSKQIISTAGAASCATQNEYDYGSTSAMYSVGAWIALLANQWTRPGNGAYFFNGSLILNLVWSVPPPANQPFCYPVRYTMDWEANIYDRVTGSYIVVPYKPSAP